MYKNEERTAMPKNTTNIHDLDLKTLLDITDRLSLREAEAFLTTDKAFSKIFYSDEFWQNRFGCGSYADFRAIYDYLRSPVLKACVRAGDIKLDAAQEINELLNRERHEVLEERFATIDETQILMGDERLHSIIIKDEAIIALYLNKMTVPELIANPLHFLKLFSEPNGFFAFQKGLITHEQAWKLRPDTLKTILNGNGWIGLQQGLITPEQAMDLPPNTLEKNIKR
jgi:hypothetical protein